MATTKVTSAGIADNATTLAKMAHGTDGNLITYDASGDPAYVTTGTSGQVLTSGGVGVAPTFQTAAGGGKVLQVVSTTVTDRNSTTNTDTSGVGTDVGLNVTLTSQSSTSRYLIMLNMGIISGSGGESVGIILSKGGSKLANGVDVSSRNGVWARSPAYTGNGNHASSLSASYLDTTSTTSGSSVTYKAGLVMQTGTGYINKAAVDTNTSSVYGSYTSSTITVMEIEA